MRLPPTPCRVCFRPRVFNKFSHFWQKRTVHSQINHFRQKNTVHLPFTIPFTKTLCARLTREAYFCFLVHQTEALCTKLKALLTHARPDAVRVSALVTRARALALDFSVIEDPH